MTNTVTVTAIIVMIIAAGFLIQLLGVGPSARSATFHRGRVLTPPADAAGSPPPDHEAATKSAEPLPRSSQAEVRIVAATPEAARRVADNLRRNYATTEQRSYPAGNDGGTRLHLTVDTARAARPARSWLASGRSAGKNPPHADEL
ncbi:hypothetical protein [Streptomyces sp. x-19]|uniref:hypothetical protein n=1 Tax=Streptomyces sp. x-19 TaxID=2789280 RepID=UPI00397F5D66